MNEKSCEISKLFLDTDFCKTQNMNGNFHCKKSRKCGLHSWKLFFESQGSSIKNQNSIEIKTENYFSLLSEWLRSESKLSIPFSSWLELFWVEFTVGSQSCWRGYIFQAGIFRLKWANKSLSWSITKQCLQKLIKLHWKMCNRKTYVNSRMHSFIWKASGCHKLQNVK